MNLPIGAIFLALTLALTVTANYPPKYFFRVPTESCPEGYKQTMLTLFNNQRSRERLPHLTHSPALDSLGLKTLREKRQYGQNYPPSMRNHHQWYHSWYNRHFHTVWWWTDEMFREIIKRTPPFNDAEWAASRSLGLACQTYDDGLTHLWWIVVFSQEESRVVTPKPKPPPPPPPPPAPPTRTPSCPSPTPCPVCPTLGTCPTIVKPSTSKKATFIVSKNTCPSAFKNFLLKRINTQRASAGLAALSISVKINSAIQDWLMKEGPEVKERSNYPDYGQLNYRKWWEALHSNQFNVSLDEPFTMKWGLGEEVLPRYTGSGGGGRVYSWSEWQATRKVGVGCLVRRGTGDREEMVTLHVAMFFEYKGIKPKPGKVTPKVTTKTPTTTPLPKLTTTPTTGPSLKKVTPTARLQQPQQQQALIIPMDAQRPEGDEDEHEDEAVMTRMSLRKGVTG